MANQVFFSATLGATNPTPHLELNIRPADDLAASRRWAELGLDGRPAAIVHPGSGAFSLARRWPAEQFAAVADRLSSEMGMSVIVPNAEMLKC